MADFKFPVFAQEGQITAEGVRLIEFIEVQFRDFDKPGEQANMSALNSLSGPIADYYLNVFKLKAKTPRAWLESQPQSARNAYEIMKYVEEVATAKAAEAAKLNETVDKTSKLEAAFNELKETLTVKVAQLEADNQRLIEENTVLKTPVKPVVKPAKGKAKVEEAIEPVTEAETTEDETSEEA